MFNYFSVVNDRNIDHMNSRNLRSFRS